MKKSSQILRKMAKRVYNRPDDSSWVGDTPDRALKDYWGLLLASGEDLQQYRCGFDNDERIIGLCLAAAIAESEGD